MSETARAERTWTVLQLIRWSTEYFEKNAVDSPRLSSELLLSHVLDIDRMKLYMQFERLLSKAELSQYRAVIERRVKDREPLQYILGTLPFYHCNLRIDSRVLIPRPETEQLVDMVLERIKSRQVHRVLDIGCGSGCIAIAIAKHAPHVQVDAIDVSTAALELAQENAVANGVENIGFKHQDFLQAWHAEHKYSMIVSNPPYISLADYGQLDPELLAHEPREALTDGEDGLVMYRRMATVFPELLEQGGEFWCEMSYGAESDLASIFVHYHPQFHKDYQGNTRFVQGHVS